MTRKALIKEILALPDVEELIIELQMIMNKEQERRLLFYNEITEQEKAEFINGEIIVHSPVTSDHNLVSVNVTTILHAYVDKHSLGRVGMEKLLIKLSRNDYEPDVCFFKQEKAKRFTSEQKFFPVPDLVVEVLSKSTAHRDRGIKFQDYQLHGIEEYWIVDVVDKIVEQYHLELNKFGERRYRLIGKLKQGDTLECYAIKDLTFPIDAVFDIGKALEVDRKVIRDEGISKGIKKGIKKGLHEGMKKEKENIVINGLKQGLSFEILSSLTGLSLDDIQAIAKKQ